MVIWLTGLSGAGKTTIGKHLFRLLKAKQSNTVFIDGDEIREIFDWHEDEAFFTLEGRHKIAKHISDLCIWLDRQEINVICCTISLFADLHRRNREALSRLHEVYINTPMEILERRDGKGLYAKAKSGEIKNVVGVDLPFTPPAHPDLTIQNADEATDPEKIAALILNKMEPLQKWRP